MLIDDVNIVVQAGHGGAGKVSFGGNGPDGGNGGKGGDVYIRVTSDLKALNQFSAKKKIVAPDGEPGSSRRSFGKDGNDVVITLPLGSTVADIELTNLDQEIKICKGGLGGRGNLEFKSATNRSPMYAQKGLPGESRELRIILRFIADFGLVGLPNAGKSSLINELTNANAAIGAYPFTTLEANLGAFGNKIIADIPGLIEGASRGRGLGTKFLKHIEKVKMIMHCISSESEDVLADFQAVDQELKKFNPELMAKKRIILLTKTDLVDLKNITQKIKVLKTLKYPVYPISIHDLDSIEKIKLVLSN